MRKRTLLPILLMLLTAVLAACSTGSSTEPETTGENTTPEAETGEIVTMYVGPELVDCTGAAPQKCMLVKENPEDDYTFFYDQIEGFNYEEGYEYELKVEVTEVENPPADASSLKYSLVEEVSKTPAAGSPETENAASGETVTMYVGPELVDCTGAAPQKCMLVKENPEDDYTFFYDQIEGFNYEEGYEYELKVEVTEVENPPADGSSLQYTLVEEVSKTPVMETSTPSLTAVTWRAAGYQNASGEFVSVLDGTKITTVFGPDGSLSGTAGCNTYNTSYTVDGTSLTIADSIATTMMACPEEIMQQEQDYLAALPQAAAFTITGDTLELLDADGVVLARFTAVSTDLAGTSWEVISYNNGNQAVVSVIIGTKITASFGEDGTLSGSAGCNDYTASYEIDGNHLTIGPAAATRKMCAAPEGIMEQEAQYLAALTTIDTFTTDGSQLQTRTADDAMAVNFQLANE